MQQGRCLLMEQAGALCSAIPLRPAPRLACAGIDTCAALLLITAPAPTLALNVGSAQSWNGRPGGLARPPRGRHAACSRPASGAASTAAAQAAPPQTPQDQDDERAQRIQEGTPSTNVLPPENSPAAATLLLKEIHRVAELAKDLKFEKAKPLILTGIGAYEQLVKLKNIKVTDDRYPAQEKRAAPAPAAEEQEEEEEEGVPAKQARRA